MEALFFGIHKMLMVIGNESIYEIYKCFIFCWLERERPMVFAVVKAPSLSRFCCAPELGMVAVVLSGFLSFVTTGLNSGSN